VLLRVLTLLSLALFAGQMLLPIVHNALVQHRVCAQHGQWVHADDSHVDHDVSRIPGLASGQVDHEHSHCDVCVAANAQQFLGLSTTPEVLSPEPVPARVAAFGASFTSGSERYHLAPKQGPPTLR
jgi:hypothetical protein